MSVNELAIDAVVAAWLVSAVAFAVRKRAVVAPSRRRAPAAGLGIALQAGAVAIVWNVRRVPPGAPILPARPMANAVGGRRTARRQS
jgi:hypothetical protein